MSKPVNAKLSALRKKQAADRRAAATIKERQKLDRFEGNVEPWDDGEYDEYCMMETTTVPISDRCEDAPEIKSNRATLSGSQIENLLNLLNQKRS